MTEAVEEGVCFRFTPGETIFYFGTDLPEVGEVVERNGSQWIVKLVKRDPAKKLVVELEPYQDLA